MLLAILASIAALAADPGEAFLHWQARHQPSEHPEPAYHFAADVYAGLAPLVAERPGVVEPFEVGRTVNGKPIWGFRVHDPARPVLTRVLVFANIHAMEWISTEVAQAFLLDFVHHPVPGVEAVVIPVLNVDGREAVERDLRAGREAWRRGNANQVDLNRDFEVNREPTAIWRHLIPGYYTTSPAPLSQPESAALDRLAAAEHFDVSVSLHSFGGFIYYPWAGSWSHPPDRAEFVELGNVMAGGQGAHAYKVRQLSRWGFFFRGQGMELDHLYGKYGTRAFLVELTRSGISPLHPSTWKWGFRTYNPADPARHVRNGWGMLRALVGHLGLHL